MKVALTVDVADALGIGLLELLLFRCLARRRGCIVRHRRLRLPRPGDYRGGNHGHGRAFQPLLVQQRSLRRVQRRSSRSHVQSVRFRALACGSSLICAATLQGLYRPAAAAWRGAEGAPGQRAVAGPHAARRERGVSPGADAGRFRNGQPQRSHPARLRRRLPGQRRMEGASQAHFSPFEPLTNAPLVSAYMAFTDCPSLPLLTLLTLRNSIASRRARGSILFIVGFLTLGRCFPGRCCTT